MTPYPPLSRLIPLSGLTIAAVCSLFSTPGCTNDGYPLENSWHVQGSAPSALPGKSTYVYRYPDVPAVMSAAAVREFVGRQYADHVVILDVWASWSLSSRDELATMTRMQADMEEDGLRVVSITLDAPGEWESTTVPKLHAARANYPCLVLQPGDKKALRDWLNKSWSYEVPARFIIDRNGGVAAAAFAGDSIASVEEQVRSVLNGDRPTALAQAPAEPLPESSPESPAAESRGTAAPEDGPELKLRLRLIACRDAESRKFSQITLSGIGTRGLAHRTAAVLDARLDRSQNPRIAIVPFASAVDQKQADPIGVEAAEQLSAALRERGFNDLATPEAAAEMLAKKEISLVALEFDPTIVQGKLPVDYLVVGWLKEPGDSAPANQTPIQRASNTGAPAAGQAAMHRSLDAE